MLWQTLFRFPRLIFTGVLAMALSTAVMAETALPAAMPEDLLPELKPLLQRAINQSPTMLAANLDVVSADATRIQGRAPMLPYLSGFAEYAYTQSAVAANLSSVSKTNGPLYGLSVSQPVFAFGALKAQNDIGKLGLHMAQRQYAEAYRLLVISVRTQYLGLIQKKATVNSLRFVTKTAESNLGVQEARLRDGRISSGDIVAPRMQVDEAKIYAEKAEEDYESSRRLLAHLLGLPDLADESIPSDIPKPTFAPETINSFFEAMKRDGLSNVLLVQVYEDTIRQSELSYKIAKVRLYPKFNVAASILQSNQTNVDSVSKRPILTAITSEVFSVGANWTLFDGFATHGAKMAALATKRLAEQKLKTFQETTSETARSLEKQIGFSGRLMDLSDTRRELQFAAISKISSDVKSGVAPQSSLDTVTQTANTAQQTALSARAEFLTEWSSYVSLLGADPALSNLPPRYRDGK